ncbi:MAG: carbohydrate kinase family protein [Candidatus Cloacimonetes bacterium]|nr:carbohydrate kinase family protein [Candidatus Cloacimonadota bacterium]
MQLDSVALERLLLPQKQSCIVGFDGFVDEIIDVVRTRKDADHYIAMEHMREFADRISRAAGLSGGIEMVCKQTKLGGNGPILARALLQHGYAIHYIGALGRDSIHPVYHQFAKECASIISLADPGITEALEFHDGKMMLSRVASMNDVNWISLLRKKPVRQLSSIARQAQLIAFTNWSSLLRMSSLIEGFMSLLEESDARPYLFFDLADPNKRTVEDIREVLDQMTALQLSAKVVFGMNRNESDLIARVLGIDAFQPVERAIAIRKRLNISQVVIHPLKGAAASTVEGSWWVDGPYTPKPRLTTGAGDNFNAGYCHGLLCGLSVEESLFCGVSTSGYYVREMHSPSTPQLLAFMQQWPQTAPMHPAKTL